MCMNTRKCIRLKAWLSLLKITSFFKKSMLTKYEYERLINFPLVEQVKDLESKLKEQVQESESHSLILQQKVVKL